MILLIDDLRTIPDADITAVSYASGKEMLENYTWDEVIFDHDLGSNDEKETGYRLLSDMLESGKRPPKIYLISSNPAGVKKMQLALARYGYGSKDGRNYVLEEN